MFKTVKKVIGGEDVERDEPVESEVDFSNMSKNEFWEYIIEENIENTNLTEEELKEMPIWEIEELLDISLSNISMPRGNRGGFYVSDRKRVITPEERKERKQRVNEELGLD